MKRFKVNRGNTLVFEEEVTLYKVMDFVLFCLYFESVNLLEYLEKEKTVNGQYYTWELRQQKEEVK